MKIGNKVRKALGQSDNVIQFSAIALSIIGLIMTASASMDSAKTGITPILLVVIKQAIYLVISLVLMWLFKHSFSFSRVKKYMTFIMAATLVVLLATRMFEEVNGAYAWLRFKLAGVEFTVQPSEFTKIVVILLIAVYLGEIQNIQRSVWVYLRPLFLTILMYLAIIVVIQKDAGSAIVIFFIALICLFVPTSRQLSVVQRRLLYLTIAGVVASFVLMTPLGINLLKTIGLKEYQIGRFQSAINPFTDRTGDGYHIVNSLIAFVKGGLFGVGLGSSTQKYGYVPEARTDSILPIIAEELGVAGILVIFILYFLIIYRLFYYAMKCNDDKAKVVLVGTAGYFFVHFVLNVGGITGLIPLTGVPLLLISSGGSSTMAVFSSLGICQAIIRQQGFIKGGRR